MRTERAALVVQGLCGVGRQIAARGEAFTGVVEILRGQAQITIGVMAAVSVDACIDGAGVGQLAACAESDAVAGCEGLAVGQVALGLHVQRATGIDRAACIKAGSLDVDSTRGRGVGQAQLSAGIELNVAAAGNQFAVEFHPDPGFGANQFDRPGVHAAERRRVDGQLRFGAAVIGAGRSIQSLCIDVVATGHNRQVLRLKLRVDLRAAGDDFEAVDIGRVESRTLDGHRTLINLKAIQSTVVEHRFAGGQSHTR
ncbi:hypothetical protein D3C87_1081950 [compost metagenome]